MPTVATRLAYRPLDVYHADDGIDYSTLPSSTLQPVLCAAHPDPRQWTAFLVGNW
jgi:hypothetical protein